MSEVKYAGPETVEAIVQETKNRLNGKSPTNHSHDLSSTSTPGFLRQLNGSTSNFLRGDGTWATPPNTTYGNATTSTAGLMSATDKSKLDGIASGANNYSLPTASSTTLGGVKTTSNVTSTSGLTPCPIISGVPYYKDTNTTYSLSSFGITATAAELNKLDGVTATATELNYVDGVTSNIQTQLNGKASSNHDHSASDITSGTLPITRGGTGATTAANARTALGITPANIGAATSGHGHSAFTGATSSGSGTAGYVPSPSTTGCYLCSDGTWAEVASDDEILDILS